MREIEAELQARIDAGAKTLCTGWLLKRQDGIVLGFTDHDEDIEIEGVVCSALSGMIGGAQETGLGLGIDSTEIEGALSASAITAGDVAAGLYDGATVERWLVDWQAPHLRLMVFSGHLGAITREGEAFRADLLGLSARLNAPIGRVCQRLCDATPGDGRCGVALQAPAYSTTATLAAAGPRGLALEGLGAFQAGWFTHGRLRWTGGAATGQEAGIAAHWVEADGHWLALDAETAATIGDPCHITAGCDREAKTCKDKFHNILNFRGFPHMPGEDWALTASPAQGDRHDGGARR